MIFEKKYNQKKMKFDNKTKHLAHFDLPCSIEHSCLKQGRKVEAFFLDH